MSGVFKGIGKVFKLKNIINPVNAFREAKRMTVQAWHNKVVRYVAIAVAVFFTAGLASGAFAAAGAGGGAAAGTAATAATGAAAGGGAAAAAGGAIGAGAGAAMAGVALPGAAVATGVTAGATVSASGALLAGTGAAFTAGAVAASSSNAAEPGVISTASSSGATGVPANTIAESSNAAGMQVAPAASNFGTAGVEGTTGATASETAATTLAPVSVTADLPAAGGLTAGDVGGAVASGAAGGAMGEMIPKGDPGSAYNSDGSLKNTEEKLADNGIDTNAKTSKWGKLWDKTKELPKDFYKGMTTSEANGGYSAMTKIMLAKSAVDMAGAYMANTQQAQMQYSGVNSKGQGPGLGIHTVDGGFGLATGGHEPTPGGVPLALQPPPSVPAAGVAPPPLVPQGAVNFMGNRNA